MHTERPKLVTAFRAGQGSPARPSIKIVHFNASGRLHKGSASAVHQPSMVALGAMTRLSARHVTSLTTLNHYLKAPTI